MAEARTTGGETIPIEWGRDEDGALMDRLRGGEVRALELLVQRWTARLGHFLYRMTGDAEAVEDLLQETFLRVHTARDTWQEGGNFSAWIHTIARRLVYDRTRGRTRKPLHRALNSAGPPGATTTLLGKIPDGAPTPYTSLSKLELEVKVDEALQGLDPIYREAVVLCDLQHLSYAEAAEVAGVPAKTLSTRLARGREQLRAALAAWWAGREGK